MVYFIASLINLSQQKSYPDVCIGGGDVCAIPT